MFLKKLWEDERGMGIVEIAIIIIIVIALALVFQDNVNDLLVDIFDKIKEQFKTI